MKYQAKIDNFDLEIEALSDSFDKSIARHEYPYRNGAELQNMGSGPKTVRLRVYFSEDRYDEHVEFEEYVRTHAEFVLVHPVTGFMTGEIEHVSVSYDTDATETVTVDLTFVEKTNDVQPVIASNLLPTVDKLYLETFEEQKLTLVDDLTEELGSEGQVVADLETGAFESTGLSTQGRYFASMLESAVTILNETGTGINPVTSIVGQLDIGDSLAERFLYSLSRAIERIGEESAAGADLPSVFVGRLQRACEDLKNSVEFAFQKTQVAIGAAIYSVVKTGEMFEKDDSARTRLKQQEAAQPFDIEGNYLDPDPQPAIYTIDELENTSALVRQMIQIAIDISRGNSTNLKIAADMLVKHVDKIKLEREKIVVIDVKETLPLHALLMRLEIPFTAAERILAINDIWNPDFVTGKVRVYA